MLQSKYRWVVKQYDETKVQSLMEQLNVEELVAKLLIQRGIDNAEQAAAFLNPKDLQFFDPFLLDEMDKVVARVTEAIKHNEHILVYGDYDADGVTSATIMMKTLRKLGANVDYYIPNRFTEGYGPNEQAFRKAKERGVSLIITVDTGIAAVHEAEAARKLGIDLIVTDHHELPPELPKTYATIHPRKKNSKYPFGDLAGVGVALKVAHALLGEVPYEFLPFAAIGTVCDLVPLLSENRLIVIHGLEQMQRTANVGIQQLIQTSGLEDAFITEESLGFSLGPRINAAGRLDSADPAVELFLTNDEEKARTLALEIDRMNKERQQLVKEHTNEAMAIVEEQFSLEDNKVLVVAKEGWNAGIIGIVASRLVETYYRPTIVLAIEPGTNEAKGSARSIYGFDIFKHLGSCRDLLPHFGGHEMAAGLSIHVDDIAELRQRLNSIAAQQLTAEHFIPRKEIDLLCEPDQITLQTIEQINSLAPFGVGNPKPLVLLDKVAFTDMKKIGSDSSHLKLAITSSAKQLDCIGFGFGAVSDKIAPHSKVSLVGELSINEWNGYRKPQIMLQDIAVKEWQLFDLRGSKQLQQYKDIWANEDNIIVSFRLETVTNNAFQAFANDIVHYDKNKPLSAAEYSSLCFLDLPKEKEELIEVVQQVNPAKIYAVFYYEEDHFFQTIPTREHFKRLYAFLLKNKSFHLKQHVEWIAKRNGWSLDTVLFMTNVFHELQFVSITDDVVSLVQAPKKRDIAESELYNQKIKQMELQQDLLYSSYNELKQWFDSILSKNNEVLEETLK